MPRTAYKHLDREHPDPWVVWDEEEQGWRMAKLILNEKRPEPLVVDDLGRQHRVDGKTRCQSLETLYRNGDVTLIPHKFAVDDSQWTPTLQLADGERMGPGFQVRDWSKVR